MVQILLRVFKLWVSRKVVIQLIKKIVEEHILEMGVMNISIFYFEFDS